MTTTTNANAKTWADYFKDSSLEGKIASPVNSTTVLAAELQKLMIAGESLMIVNQDLRGAVESLKAERNQLKSEITTLHAVIARLNPMLNGGE